MRSPDISTPNRREFLASAAGLAMAPAVAAPPTNQKAQIAITLDLEMSRNFPTWDQTHWDYEKGNLDAATKRYAVEAARRIKARGSRIHFFALEQADVGWLKEIVAQGHPVGNHTYDHVNVKASRREDIQFRFRRAPWLIEGKSIPEVIADNIRLAERALRERIGIAPAGFRTPGGFDNGLADRPDLQAMLRTTGYAWASSQYPAHPITGKPGQGSDPAVVSAIVGAQDRAQPFVYPSGLIEVPMSPISDVTAFRAGRWTPPAFLDAIRAAVSRAIATRSVFCFLGHPSCLGVVDPHFRTLDLIANLVHDAGDAAGLADLNAIAQRASSRPAR